MHTVDDDPLDITRIFFNDRADPHRWQHNRWTIVELDQFALDPNDPLHSLLGFTLPAWSDEINGFQTTICPERVVEAARGIVRPDEWPDYLSAIWVHLQLHIEFDLEDAPESLVDALMESQHLRFLSLLHRVQVGNGK